MNQHEFDENEVLRDALSGLNKEVPPMPEHLHAAWMQKVEEDQMDKNHTRKSITRFLSIAAAMVFIIGGTLLSRDSLTTGLQQTRPASVENGSLKTVNAAYSYSSDEEAEAESAMDNGVMLTMARGTNTAAAMPAVTAQKIIRTANMTIITQTYETALSSLKSSCEEQGGWIESTNESANSRTGLRTAYLTLRIPQDGLDAYLDSSNALGRVTSKSESAQDVTASYQDTQTRLNTQLALMARLQALITESGDLSDLLALESQIAETQYQIDSLQSSLNRTDRQVSYSTVSITLKEEAVPELTDTTVSLGERIISAVKTGCTTLTTFLGDMVVFLMAALPFLAVVAAALILVKLITRRKK